jgi:hypothetical protein
MSRKKKDVSTDSPSGPVSFAPTQEDDDLGPRIDPAGGPEDDRDTVFNREWWESIAHVAWDREKGAFDWTRFADDPYLWTIAENPPTKWPPEKDDVPFYDEPWE